MKRAVRYSFLDFSSLAKRRRALEAELELNRRTAPMLYRRLVAVRRAPDGGLALEGRGRPLEWLLEMRRFDQAALLDRIAAQGELTVATIDALAVEIALFHEQAERRPDLGGHAGMRQVIDGNALDLGSLAGRILARDRVDELNRRTGAELERQSDRLERRRRAGFVRHCHGDLHLGNIVLLDRRPVLFDCLEFDPALATIDTFYDLAFLLMDLCHRDLAALAQRLLSGYLDASWDDGGVALLPFFLSVRAAIRAKVQGFAADLEEGRGGPGARDRGGARLPRAGACLPGARAGAAGRDRRGLRNRQDDACAGAGPGARPGARRRAPAQRRRPQEALRRRPDRAARTGSVRRERLEASLRDPDGAGSHAPGRGPGGDRRRRVPR